ncbi:type 1 glutamine amidotransferase domain-containing protein [Jejuia spongiicola]|uniref:Type 1 glutamine amidotransferase domain-containing protein n=1 Tax=Jejuia spongiicola TaxID=2942207 RepID=A0ABT0Q922_9FLAO|nr:type 1 glutamine amidotransferase domain-containing protein [Jejuia spongiicola]MCL6293475.1 type 1 glutamine amidotransferase domain-containing protein [Jejuia spongiicola]
MKSEKKIGIGIVLGTAFGIAIGLAINNLPVWIGVGVVIGAATGATFRLKKHPKIKWALISIFSLLILLISFGAWFINLLPIEEMKKDLTNSKVEEIQYLSQNKTPKRGKILAVVTNSETMGNSGKKTGYELTELSRAYYVFEANGFEVDIASPLGGKPPVVLDDDDMGIYDYAFLNDSIAQNKASNTIAINDVSAEDYSAVFFVGGKGAMFDFPENKFIQEIVKKYYQSGKVVGAVCHGPAALVNVTLDNGTHLLENKMVSSFTNEEELLLISDAKSIFPFLLQDKLIAGGAKFNKGAMYLETISHDNNLITGQNPWSTWKLAETIIEQLGYTPKYREITGEENAGKILLVYEREGSDKAKQLIDKLLIQEKKSIDRLLIASHSVIAAMNGEIGRFFGLLGLTSYAKKKSKIN